MLLNVELKTESMCLFVLYSGCKKCVYVTEYFEHLNVWTTLQQTFLWARDLKAESGIRSCAYIS
jgi:hypothetical protein